MNRSERMLADKCGWATDLMSSTSEEAGFLSPSQRLTEHEIL